MDTIVIFIQTHWTSLVAVVTAIWTLVQEIRHQRYK